MIKGNELFGLFEYMTFIFQGLGLQEVKTHQSDFVSCSYTRRTQPEEKEDHA